VQSLWQSYVLCSTGRSSVLRHCSDHPRLEGGSLDLNFTADVFPRSSTISYSICCPSLSVLSPLRSTAKMCTKHVLAAALRLNESITLAWTEPFDCAAAHSPSPNRRSTMSSLGRPTVVLQARDVRCGRQLESSRIVKMASADLNVLDLDQTSGLPLQKRLRGGKGDGRSGSP